MRRKEKALLLAKLYIDNAPNQRLSVSFRPPEVVRDLGKQLRLQCGLVIANVDEQLAYTTEDHLVSS